MWPDGQCATKLMQFLHDFDWWVNIGRLIDASPLYIGTVRKPWFRAFQTYIHWLGNHYSIRIYSGIQQGYSLHQFCCWYQGYTNQYEVYLPLALMTSLILLGMLSINSWHCATPILSHSTCICSQSSNIPFGGSGYSSSLLLRINQRCSIGLRSGDWGGHTMTSNSWSSNHFLALKVYSTLKYAS